MAVDLWGEEILVEEPTKKQKRRAESKSCRRRPVYCSENNDIDGWFRENNPQTLAECNDIRKALLKKAQVDNYNAEIHYTRTEKRLVQSQGSSEQRVDR